MRKRLNNEQINEIEQTKSTFPNPVLLKPKEIAILNSPTKFPSTNRSRHYKMLTDKAEESIKELTFLFKHLHLSYRNNIVTSKNFNDFLESILYLNILTENLDDKTKNITFRIASELFVNSFGMIMSTLPKEFQKLAEDSVKPFIDLLTAISDSEQRNFQKDIPKLRIPDKLSSFTARN